MHRDHKTEQEKKLRRLYEEYRNTWGSRKEHGQWEEVVPYQKGWVRFFVVRADAQNRADSSVLSKVLGLVNHTQYCDNEDFMVRIYKKGRRTKELKVIKHTVKYLTEPQYALLDERVKSYFTKKIWTEKVTYPTKHYVTRTGYVVIDEYVFVLHVEPNIITHHWVPDPAWESHCAEIRNKISRDNLWPKIYHMLGENSHQYDDRLYTRWKSQFVELDDESNAA